MSPNRTPGSLPSLSASPSLRLATFAGLYFAQGLPMGMLGVGLPTAMAARGITAAEIGSFIGISLLPWSLKLMSGPIMDRWTFLPMGRRRPWIVAAQSGMIMTLVFMALVPDPFSRPGTLAALAFTLNLFMVFQDAAVDGMAIEMVPVDQQGRANAFMLGGRRVGASLGTAGGVWMINGPGFSAAMLSLATAVACVLTLALVLKERTEERLLPWTGGRASPENERLQPTGWRDIRRSLVGALLLPTSVVGVSAIFIYAATVGVLSAMSPIVAVQELGWSDTAYSQLQASAGLLSGVLGMGLGGFVIDRIGRRLAITGGLALLALSSVAMGLLPALWGIGWTFHAWLVLFVFVNALVTIAFYGLMMVICWKRIGATQFSIYMTGSNLGMSTGPVLFGAVAGALTYPSIFLVAAFLMIVPAGLVVSMQVERHRERLAVLDTVQDPL